MYIEYVQLQCDATFFCCGIVIVIIILYQRLVLSIACYFICIFFGNFLIGQGLNFSP